MHHEEHGKWHLYCLDHAVVAYDANILAIFDGEEIENEMTTTGPTTEGQTDEQHLTIVGKIVSSDLWKKDCQLVGYFNKLIQARAELHNVKKEEEKIKTQQIDIIQDVVTYWWSTLKMMDILFHLCESLIIYARRAIFKSVKMIIRKMLSHDEWEALDKHCCTGAIQGCSENAWR